MSDKYNKFKPKIPKQVKIGLIATNPKNYFQSRITKIMILIKY